METAIVSIISVALLVLGGMTMSQDFLTSADKTTVNLSATNNVAKEIMRTKLAALSASNKPANTLEIHLRNSGQTKLAGFSQWDVIVHHTDIGSVYRVAWLPYTSGTPGNNQWTVKGIYVSSGNEKPEIYEPGILNPGEEMKIQAKLNPAVKKDSNNKAIIITASGVSTSVAFVGER